MNQEKVRALEKIIERDYRNLAGLVVRRDDKTVYESYFNRYTAGNALHVFSVTKSIVSALFGIALEKKLLASTEQKVLEFFPDYAAAPGETTIQKITIQNLLTMTAPYKYEREPYEKFFASPNPIQDALDLMGGDKPIGTFQYSAIGGTQVLAGILTRAVGQPMLDFAQENLFGPLDIAVPHSVILHDEKEHFAVMNDKNSTGWVVDPQGINTAGWGLFLKPTDMAKVGQLYLNGGVWNGKQIVPQEWIAESTREHSRCVQLGNLAYGYLWWLIDGESYAAMGDGGNVIYVNPRKNLTVAIASTFAPQAKDRIRLIKGLIEPMTEE